MIVNLLTEEQAKQLAIDCSNRVMQSFMDKVLPNLMQQKPSQEKDILLTPKELAAYWGVHIQTIYNKKRSKAIPCEQNGRIVRFSKQAIDKISKLK